MHRLSRDHKRGYVKYGAEPSSCKACPRKSRCTNSQTARWLSRGSEEEYLERVRAYRHTEPYRKALRKRAVCVEPLFAEAKEWHGFGRFRLRRLERVNAEALVIASGQNLKRLVTFGLRGPKKLATAVALRPPEGSSSRLIRRHRTPRRGVFQQADRLGEVGVLPLLHGAPETHLSGGIAGGDRCGPLAPIPGAFGGIRGLVLALRVALAAVRSLQPVLPARGLGHGTRANHCSGGCGGLARCSSC